MASNQTRPTVGFIVSFVLIIHKKINPENKLVFVLDIVKQRTHDVDLKKYAVKLLEELGSFRYTVKVLNNIKIS